VNHPASATSELRRAADRSRQWRSDSFV
jgi:hypothetical protein